MHNQWKNHDNELTFSSCSVSLGILEFSIRFLLYLQLVCQVCRNPSLNIQVSIQWIFLFVCFWSFFGVCVCRCSVQAVDLIPQGILWFQYSFLVFYRMGIFKAFLMERTLFPVLHCELRQSMPAHLIGHSCFKRVGRPGSFCQPWKLTCCMSLIKLFHISVFWSVT